MNRLRTYWVDQVKWWSNRSLEWWAAHLTALYIGGAITIMGARFDDLITLKLNEIGDLAAGVFGPVAFLWLILGYLQQGRELKLSSDALQLQAAELKNSVEQQTIMAQAALAQIDEQRKISLLQIEERDRLYKADLRLLVLETDTDVSGVTKAKIRIVNSGPIAHAVHYRFDPPLGDMGVGAISSISSSSEIVIDVNYEVGESSRMGMCLIDYLDDGGKKHLESFFYDLDPSTNGVVFNKITLPAMKESIASVMNKKSPVL
ncbi:hypothetical protein [Pseudomonas monachiensis]|uniref:Uncharacterized protein n=1 Tax=Pseudomonas monachiensis TaxID=3060212 RepID=A0ABW9HAT5_9PSED